MKVKDLIKHLDTIDQDHDVYVFNEGDEILNTTSEVIAVFEINSPTAPDKIGCYLMFD